MKGSKLIVLIAFIILTSACTSPENAKRVQVYDNTVTNLLMTDRPVPSNPEKAWDINFAYTGKVKVGEYCDVITVVEFQFEWHYKLNCKGIIGWLPSDLVKVIEWK